MKFITYNVGDALSMVLFDRDLHHDSVATSLGIARSDVCGAGCVEFDGPTPKCFGESVSLGVKATVEDTEVLFAKLGFRPAMSPCGPRKDGLPPF